MSKQHTSSEKTSFVFNLDILIEDVHHAAALEKLIVGINKGQFDDYRILSGIQLGQLIDSRKAEHPYIEELPMQPTAEAEIEPQHCADSNTAEQTPTASDIYNKLQLFMSGNTLVRMLINKGLGIKKNIPCRILRMDQDLQLITVYHVDEKQVYTFHLYEVEDIL